MPDPKSAIVFVHGLAKKPPVEKLQEIWHWGLERDNPMPNVFKPPNPGIRLGDEGIPVLFNYYADVFYGTDYETDTQSYYESNETGQMASEGLDRVEPGLPTPMPQAAREQAFLDGFEAKLRLQLDLPVAPGAVGAAETPSDSIKQPDGTVVASAQYEIMSWLPEGVKQAIIKKAAMEAYYFLFDKEYARSDGQRFQVRKELRQRLLADLSKAATKADNIVLVAHSMGTMVAYDALRRCPECPPVATLITIGSPLGVQEVQDELRVDGAKGVDFPAEKLGRWINIFDPLDPICGADPQFSNDYTSVGGKSVVDVRESNWGKWRHTSTHYLAGNQFRKHLLQALGLS